MLVEMNYEVEVLRKMKMEEEAWCSVCQLEQHEAEIAHVQAADRLAVISHLLELAEERQRTKAAQMPGPTR